MSRMRARVPVPVVVVAAAIADRIVPEDALTLYLLVGKLARAQFNDSHLGAADLPGGKP